MHLTHLSLTNYRNFARLDMDVPGGPLLFVGNNAQGKTSLLEAVYYLATFTSFHASSDRQLINFSTEGEPLAVARIVADFRRPVTSENTSDLGVSLALDDRPAGGSHHTIPGSHRLEVRIIRENPNGAARVRKEILLDGVTRRVGEAIGAFNAVLFLPQMLVMVEGGPEERRRYLNLALSQVLPHYAARLTEYQRALTQRNALLKLLGERGGDPGQLSYWDEQIALIGARILHARIQAVLELERLARRFHHELTRGGEILRLDYQPSYDPAPGAAPQLKLNDPVDRSKLSVETICQGFREKLQKVRGEEIARGVTTIGPHRDELRFFSNGIDLGIYGSRGQGRTAVLSMKLAEVAWMKAKTGQWPVLLLDEVMAELDPARRADLLSRLAESEQSLLTTTDLDLFSPEFIHKAKIWHIDTGRVSVE